MTTSETDSILNELLSTKCGIDDVVVYDAWMTIFQEMMYHTGISAHSVSTLLSNYIKTISDATHFKKCLDAWGEFNEKACESKYDSMFSHKFPAKTSKLWKYFSPESSLFQSCNCEYTHVLSVFEDPCFNIATVNPEKFAS